MGNIFSTSLTFIFDARWTNKDFQFKVSEQSIEALPTKGRRDQIDNETAFYLNFQVQSKWSVKRTFRHFTNTNNI